MGGSNTGRTNQVNTKEIHTAINNQDLSSDKKINDTTNIRNYDIVHGNDIKGGMNTFNGLTNTASGTQVFKLMELNDLGRVLYSAGSFTRDPTIIDRHVTRTPGILTVRRDPTILERTTYIR